MKYGLYLNEVLMEQFETEREAYKAADFANEETSVTHHVKKIQDPNVEKYEKLIKKVFLLIDSYHSEDRDADKVIDDIFDELKRGL